MTLKKYPTSAKYFQTYFTNKDLDTRFFKRNPITEPNRATVTGPLPTFLLLFRAFIEYYKDKVHENK